MPDELLSHKRVNTLDDPSGVCIVPARKKPRINFPDATLLYAGPKNRSQSDNIKCKLVRQPSIPVLISESCSSNEPELLDLTVGRQAKEFRVRGLSFPRFRRGTIYVVVAESDERYIYAFEKDVLARASSWFAHTLDQPFNDFDKLLAEKIVKSSGYEARYELKYDEFSGKWGLKKSSFTRSPRRALPTIKARLKSPSYYQPCNPERLGSIGPNEKEVQKALATESSAANDAVAANFRLVTINSTHENGQAQDTIAINQELKVAKNEESIDFKFLMKQDDDGRKSRTCEAKPCIGNEEQSPHGRTSCGIPLEICEAYNNMFLLMHNIKPRIDINDTNNALLQTEEIIKTAGYYGFLPLARPYLSNHLLNYGRELYKAVLRNPPRWLKVSLFLRSAPIFNEAIVQMVGYYPNYPWRSPPIEDLPNQVLELVERKAKELKTLKAVVNEELFTSSIAIKGHTITLSNIDKASFSTWFIVQLWRDWFCHSLSKHAKSKHNIGTIYRLMAKGNEAYLPQTIVYTTLQRYCGKDFSMCSLKDVEEDLRLMKEFAQRTVKALVVNNSMLDVEEEGIEHLTCTQVANEDLPWDNP